MAVSTPIPNIRIRQRTFFADSFYDHGHTPSTISTWLGNRTNHHVLSVLTDYRVHNPLIARIRGEFKKRTYTWLVFHAMKCISLGTGRIGFGSINIELWEAWKDQEPWLRRTVNDKEWREDVKTLAGMVGRRGTWDGMVADFMVDFMGRIEKGMEMVEFARRWVMKEEEVLWVLGRGFAEIVVTGEQVDWRVDAVMERRSCPPGLVCRNIDI